MTRRDRESRGGASRSSSVRRIGGRRRVVAGWLFVLPALAMYAVFVLQPLTQTIRYSLYRWDGIGPRTWVGLANYRAVIDDPDLLGSIFNSLKLVVFFSLIPVTLGLIAASVIHRVVKGRMGTAARTILFLPQVIPLVAAGIIWGWLLSLSGLVNQTLEALRLDGITRAWLGDFDWALPAVGMIGVWVLLGFCTVLLLTGMGKIDTSLYEAARLDGAGWLAELRAVTRPGVRYELGVCLTVTVIAALAAFDIVYVSTGGGPGNATAVPGIQIYILAFLERQVGLASALAVMVMLLVLVVVIPMQRLTRQGSR